jgi:hypothetical protein
VKFDTVTLRELEIEDERSFQHVALYDALKRVLLRAGQRFKVPARGASGASWNRVVFLNLTFWSSEAPVDVLVDRTLPADVVTHVAWHHLARTALAGAALSADALFLGEAIASAFDLYLVGRLLGHAPDADFLQTQVPAMSEVAAEQGMLPEHFEALLQTVAEEPERAFEDVRQLLFDAATALVGATDVDAAASALGALDGRRFAPLLHHFELSNWILYARAYAPEARAPVPAVRALDAALRSAPVSLDWLEQRWVRPAR